MANVGDVVSIEIEDLETPRPVTARVVRLEGEGFKLRYGVRFEIDSPEQRAALNSLMLALSQAKGTSSREHPRIYRYVSISYRTAEHFEALMGDISRTGLGFDADAPLKPGEDLTVEIRVGERERALKLPCIVASSRAASGASAQMMRFRIGVRFAELTEEQQGAVDELIQSLVAGS